MNAKAILDRTEYHLRAQRRIALDNNHEPAYWAADDAIVTVKAALKDIKREQKQQHKRAPSHRPKFRELGSPTRYWGKAA
jgi:hypothetical protein